MTIGLALAGIAWAALAVTSGSVLPNLAPLIVVFVLIVAAAGLTRGTDLFGLFGVGAIMGIGTGGSGRVGKGVAAGKSARGIKKKIAGYGVGKSVGNALKGKIKQRRLEKKLARAASRGDRNAAERLAKIYESRGLDKSAKLVRDTANAAYGARNASMARELGLPGAMAGASAVGWVRQSRGQGKNLSRAIGKGRIRGLRVGFAGAFARQAERNVTKSAGKTAATQLEWSAALAAAHREASATGGYVSGRTRRRLERAERALDRATARQDKAAASSAKRYTKLWNLTSMDSGGWTSRHILHPFSTTEGRAANSIGASLRSHARYEAQNNAYAKASGGEFGPPGSRFSNMLTFAEAHGTLAASASWLTGVSFNRPSQQKSTGLKGPPPEVTKAKPNNMPPPEPGEVAEAYKKQPAKDDYEAQLHAKTQSAWNGKGPTKGSKTKAYATYIATGGLAGFGYARSSGHNEVLADAKRQENWQKRWQDEHLKNKTAREELDRQQKEREQKQRDFEEQRRKTEEERKRKMDQEEEWKED